MADNVKKPSLFERVKKFFADQKGEMKKIVWPSKKQTINNTQVVLAAVAITAVAVCCFDWILSAIVTFVINH